MPNLKCEVRNCSYNEEYYCCLSRINVGHKNATNAIETCCESFVESEYVASNCSMGPEEVVDIQCDAVECVFNCSKLCTAVDVEVGGASTACHSDDTQCNTFICGENRQ